MKSNTLPYSAIVLMYTIHHQIFEKILHDVYLKMLEKFEETTPLSLVQIRSVNKGNNNDFNHSI